MTLDIRSMWDFEDPAASEARFREALENATGDDALVLRTQIARSYGLRREGDRAREELEAIRPLLDAAGPEPRVRYELEVGRTWISAVTAPDERTPGALDTARRAYATAFETARDAGLDDLAVDAVHMMAFVDTDPAAQLAWNDRGLDLALASTKPAARRWEASLRNNRGTALHELGRDDDALEEFRRALVLREAEGDPGNIRVARWMIAWALRHLGRLAEALPIQIVLAEECEAAGEPDPYVLEELELLYAALGDPERAAAYANLRSALTST